ncbi:hypothetical protein [Gordonia otitidis]|uniref:Uncharacterized protein n=1 Tax=Gordonia otitidis (strain DSM 44809 / CCUG 52243 / JCM 12355 / NBRC 100426 / IFM 10032) TaxID=1108044 RepID=H5TU40_GORO1|nr:hypothetical protein [Gordonia otitidis]GAB36998.1 hypothetical protein GOOTI_252_00010 [Gordonia otitidis NBRC 100426]
MKTSRLICTKSKFSVAIDLPADVVRVATCTSIADFPQDHPIKDFVLEPVEVADDNRRVDLSLPAGALVWVMWRIDLGVEARSPALGVRVYVVGVDGECTLVRESDGSETAAMLTSMSDDRFKIQCAALPEQAGVRRALFDELVADGTAEVFDNVSIRWAVWAKWDPGVGRNGWHTEQECTVVDPGGRYVWVFADRVIRKARDNHDMLGELGRLKAEAATADKLPQLRAIGASIYASLEASRPPDLSELARLSARDRERALADSPAVSSPAQWLLVVLTRDVRYGVRRVDVT